MATRDKAIASSVKVEDICDSDDEQKTRAVSLLEALEKRDEHRRRTLAAEKAAEKAAKKAKLATDKLAEHAADAAERCVALAIPATPPCKPTPSSIDGSNKKMLKRPASWTAPFSKDVGEAVVPTSTSVVRWTYCHERSRTQFMARSGLKGPGSTKKFEYGDEAEYPDEASALNAVMQFVTEKNLALP